MGKNEKNSKDDYGAESAGLGTAGYGEVNKSYDEEKFHSRQGHGFAAERMNNLYDKAHGKDARIVGDDNKKDGADRVVDGVEIQSKYCQTGQKCVDMCFDKNGNFRYYTRDGRPMQIEVPSDKYEEALRAMEQKIREGKVKGVTDPEEAKNIIRKGHFTYKQACNVAKAGTIESITYDAVNGCVIATSAFGVTAAITFAVSIWNGDDTEEAIKKASLAGLKVGGTAFLTTIIAGQLSKAGLNSALVNSSEGIANLMGTRMATDIANAFRNGSNIYGAAALKSAAKILRGTVITTGASIAVVSAVDVADALSGRISGAQLFKNVTNTTVSAVAGSAGWIIGASVGSKIAPGVGTIVGGVVGSLAVGTAASGASNAILDEFIEDDAVKMTDIIQDVFSRMSREYLLSQGEVEMVVDRLDIMLSGDALKDMYASSNRRGFARKLLRPIIDDVVLYRSCISEPSDSQLLQGMGEVLEDIAAEPV